MLCYEGDLNIIYILITDNILYMIFGELQIKKHLDFLLDHFPAQEITHFPYILNKNIDEIKTRVEEMKKLGVPVTLPYIYQSKKRYLNVIRKYSVDNPRNQTGQDDFLAIEKRLSSQKNKNIASEPNT